MRCGMRDAAHLSITVIDHPIEFGQPSSNVKCWNLVRTKSSPQQEEGWNQEQKRVPILRV